MQLPLRALLLAASTAALAAAFAPPSLPPARTAARSATLAPLRAGTDVEALLAKVRALREAAAADEASLQTASFDKQKTKDDATDLIISQLFDGEEAGLVDRLRGKRLAAGMLVQVAERLHGRETAARGLEHVETAVRGETISFQRVAKEDEAELARVAGLVERLILAAEVLDQEFLADRSNENMTNSDLTHWGGGKTADLLRDKLRVLGREHSEQFKKRQQEFFDAATRTHSRDEFHEDSWQDSWKTVDERSLKKKDDKKGKKK